MMKLSEINWFGFTGGALTLVTVAVSLFYPWWQLIVGDGFLKANASPVNTNFGFLGTSFTIPLILALNIVSVLSLVASGVVMLIYSVFPSKSYSKHLLGFAYKKPLFTVIFFVAGLLTIALIFQAVSGVAVPLMGSATMTLPEFLTSGFTISVLMSGGFLWPFWLGIVAAALCIVARLYHKKVAVAPASPAASSVAPPTTTATAPK